MSEVDLTRWTGLGATIVAGGEATWLSPQVRPGFGGHDLVPSWTADTPGRTWIEIEARVTTVGGTTSGWYRLGRWAATRAEITRTSIPDQADAHARVDTDRLVAAAGVEFASWQLRITLHRPDGEPAAPTLRSAGAVTRSAPTPSEPSAPGPARGITIEVPRLSQRVHAGHYPELNGGGGAWCSPTCLAMLLDHHGTGPGPADWAWVDPAYADPQVCHAARATWDPAFGGCGNWAFNTAYAGSFGLDAHVTRLRSLAEAEEWIAAGVPLVLSVAYRAGEVPGVDYDTDGHLVMLVGFTEAGDPVMNDPAADSNEAVRKVFGRRELESAWQRASGGITYVIRAEAPGR